MVKFGIVGFGKIGRKHAYLIENLEKGEKTCKAMLLSFFDEDTRDTLKIDLWTKEMQVVEMDRFFYQNLRAMADTYFRATKNQELANHMQQFANYFGEKTEVIPKPDPS